MSMLRGMPGMLRGVLRQRYEHPSRISVPTGATCFVFDLRRPEVIEWVNARPATTATHFKAYPPAVYELIYTP